jgi:LytS/YehU family sensor histidine kinase
MKVDGEFMKMKLINSKPVEFKPKEAITKGIGISNVQTRLNMLYPGQHELVITEEENVFIVNLVVQLEKHYSNSRVEYPQFNPVHAAT